MIGKLLETILTLGNNLERDERKHVYEQLRVTYLPLHEQYVLLHKEFQTTVGVLVDAKRSALSTLRKVAWILERVTVEQGQDGLSLSPAIQRFERTLQASSTTLSTANGAGWGAALGFGAWEVASVFGTASTGAAISGLSGAAATNATLAWLGGGSLAAGGGGIAAGTAVLGGIVVVPAVILGVVGLNQSVNAELRGLNHAITQMQQQIPELRREISFYQEVLPALQSLTHDVSYALWKLRESYYALFAWPIFSKLSWRWRRESILASREQRSHIDQIHVAARELVRLVETPVIDAKRQVSYRGSSRSSDSIPGSSAHLAWRLKAVSIAVWLCLLSTTIIYLHVKAWYEQSGPETKQQPLGQSITAEVKPPAASGATFAPAQELAANTSSSAEPLPQSPVRQEEISDVELREQVTDHEQLERALAEARLAYAHGEYQAAETAYWKVLSLTPDNSEATKGIEQTRRALAAELRIAAASNTESLQKAEALFRAGEYEQATRTVDDVLTAIPNDSQAQALLTRIKRAQEAEQRVLHQ